MKKSIFTFFALCSSTLLYSQVEVDKPIQLTGADGSRSINFLELPVAGTDAVNKDYVDAAVSAGGGSGSGKPEEISNITGSAVVYSDAVQYCENLSENGHDDWRLPEAGEIQYFAGMSGATADFLWTKTLTGSQDFATNQNFITVRLTDGKWKYGGVARFYFPARSFSGTTNNGTFTSVATFSPLTAGNLFVPTSMYAYSSAGYQSGNAGEARLKYTFPDGSFFYSNTITFSYSSSDIVNVTSIPILNEGAAYAKVEVEVRATSGSFNKTGAITIGGYEITLAQKDGVTLNARCVR
ncbi:MAG: hypothetical protein IT223_09835 [Crocinitomicaceae bacterium]|nr:hypothetical protein [Crocinitomicaceae bacterium]